MLSRTINLLRVSPFSLFMKDLKKKRELTGMTLAQGVRVASRMYRALRPAQRRALQSRANQLTYPALEAFNAFQRRESRHLIHLKNAQRQRIIGEMWRKSEQRKNLELKKLREKAKERREARLSLMKTKKKVGILPSVRKFRIKKVDDYGAREDVKSKISKRSRPSNKSNVTSKDKGAAALKEDARGREVQSSKTGSKDTGKDKKVRQVKKVVSERLANEMRRRAALARGLKDLLKDKREEKERKAMKGSARRR
uniref:WGS project CAEQ00000000 data, annotated contig 771 n=1 Tax=Trypanosoma congolense (strain IL3000) TaxID=1068625 RepID=F9WID7_TRYCI|nr:unnamed protein product [Trypanosoma congolense IL3000]